MNEKKTPMQRQAEKKAAIVAERIMGKQFFGIVKLKMSHRDPKLLPCPFCGCEKLELHNTHSPSYWIECTGCQVQLGGQYYEIPSSQTKFYVKQAHQMAKRSAIEAWNRRV